QPDGTEPRRDPLYGWFRRGSTMPEQNDADESRAVRADARQYVDDVMKRKDDVETENPTSGSDEPEAESATQLKVMGTVPRTDEDKAPVQAESTDVRQEAPQKPDEGRLIENGSKFTTEPNLHCEVNITEIEHAIEVKVDSGADARLDNL